MSAKSVSPSKSDYQGEMLATGEEAMEGKDVGGCDEQERLDGQDGKVLDARKAEIMRRPYTPTQEEVEEHMATHLPYRSWCPHCVAGRGIAGHHVTHAEGKKLGITISMDYCFLVPMERSQHVCPVLVVYDGDLEAIWALPVVAKGPTKVAVDWLVSRLDEAGYRGQRITLKSDGETRLQL